MEKLKKLISLCKCSVSVDVNANRDFRKTVKEYIEENIHLKAIDNSNPNDLDLDGETMQKMIELNTCINIHFYPETPVGFMNVWHYDLEMALDKCLAFFEPS